MSNDLLQEAIKKLGIHSVCLRECGCRIKEQFNSLNIGQIDTRQQTFRNIDKIEVIEVSRKDDDQIQNYFYSFHYDIGARLVESNQESELDGDDEGLGLVVIEAKFEALYVSQEQVPEEQLKAFSANNVGYHVWPYWREYLQSTCSRMGIEPISVPFYRFQGSDLVTED